MGRIISTPGASRAKLPRKEYPILKEFRTKYNLSQAALARLLGYGRGGAAKISIAESGKKPLPQAKMNLFEFIRERFDNMPDIAMFSDNEIQKIYTVKDAIKLQTHPGIRIDTDDGWVVLNNTLVEKLSLLLK